MGVGDLSDVERPKIGDDLYQHPHHPQLPVMDPKDGMPRQVSVTSMEDSKAPPLEPESFVCMGDESVFVIRDQWGEPLVRIEPARVKRWLPTSGTPGWVATLTEAEIQAAGVYSVFGTDVFWFEVWPLRPQCQFYKRVMTDFEKTEFKAVERVCAAQKTDNGEYLALRDTRVYACEHRSPRDFVSEERLRTFDAAAVASAKKTDEEWDGDAALAALNPGKTP